MSDDLFNQYWLKPDAQPFSSESDLGTTPISQQTHHFMQTMLQWAEEVPPPQTTATITPFTHPTRNQTASPRVPQIIPDLMQLVGKIHQELDSDLAKLLSLNPSRRQAIADHLFQLAGIPLKSKTDVKEDLKDWMDSPQSSAKSVAQRTYLEEVALFTLSQALLLKNWSDRGLRTWSASDLGRLNWTLSTTLKPLIPLDREGWQMTRPNLYSWYSPSPALQLSIWTAFEQWKIHQEGPQLLFSFVKTVKSSHAHFLEQAGYDIRFFQACWNILWKNLQALQAPAPSAHSYAINKNLKMAFSPTLRDGSLFQYCSEALQWIGMENSSLYFMIAELSQIWQGPIVPPLWHIGTGLEAHSKSQLSFSVHSPKPSILSRITEIESCDLAFVLEEKTVRTHSKSHAALKLKEQVEALPFFKKLRTANTSLGTLQACVALNKLRPGGILIWAREEILNEKEGREALYFLLNRAKLLYEWNYSALEHHLPTPIPLTPQHLYVFQREIDTESRFSHRPIQISIQGQLRSHIELSTLLEEAFQAIHTSPTSPPSSEPRWTISTHCSPTSQRDWMEKWPDPTSPQRVQYLNYLRSVSLPLAQWATIRPATEKEAPQEQSGFLLFSELIEGERKLITKPLPSPYVKGHGFFIFVSQSAWIPPLQAYLRSRNIQEWLEHYAERKSEKWVLNEQLVKWIPIPKLLLKALEVPFPNSDNQADLCPHSWNNLLTKIAAHPEEVQKELLTIKDLTAHTLIFKTAATLLAEVRFGQERLISLVTADGKIRWTEMLSILPKESCIPMTQHPQIRFLGSLPPHLPIFQINRVQMPTPGILLATESGFHLHISSDIPLLIPILWDQLKGVVHPTWNELTHYLRVPKKIELAESTASEILNAHTLQLTQEKNLESLLASCQFV